MDKLPEKVWISPCIKEGVDEEASVYATRVFDFLLPYVPESRLLESQADLDKAAAIIECKDREISAFRQERYTLKAELAAAKEALEDRVFLKRQLSALQEENKELREALEKCARPHSFHLVGNIEEQGNYIAREVLKRYPSREQKEE